MNKIDNFYTKDIGNFSKSYISYLKEIFDKVSLSKIKSFVEVLLTARESRSTIFFIGNGGSAATSSYLANDLAFGTNEYGPVENLHMILDHLVSNYLMRLVKK